MATLKHIKMKEDAHRKMLEKGIQLSIEGIIAINSRLDDIEEKLDKLESKPKPKGGRNV